MRVRISNINTWNCHVDSKYLDFDRENEARAFLRSEGFKFVCPDAATKPYDGDCEWIKYTEAVIY